jgi:hypothetical protein
MAYLATGDKTGHYNPQLALLWEGKALPIRSVSPSGNGNKGFAHIVHRYNQGWVHGPNEITLNAQVFAWDLGALAIEEEPSSTNGHIDSGVTNGTFAFASIGFDRCVIQNINITGIEAGQGPIVNVTLLCLNVSLTPRGETVALAAAPASA